MNARAIAAQDDIVVFLRHSIAAAGFSSGELTDAGIVVDDGKQEAGA